MRRPSPPTPPPTLAVLTVAAGVLAAAPLACAAPPPPPPAGPAFAPERWFLGDMRSTGALKPAWGGVHALAVESHGRREADGALRLDQVIRWGGGAVDRRFWRMRRRADGGYAATLSDAAGPVALEVAGARMHLRYRLQGRLPATMEQWLDLRPDGRTLANRGEVRVLGVPVARLDETIVHDPS